jgi:hypothetical protein
VYDSQLRALLQRVAPAAHTGDAERALGGSCSESAELEKVGFEHRDLKGVVKVKVADTSVRFSVRLTEGIDPRCDRYVILSVQAAHGTAVPTAKDGQYTDDPRRAHRQLNLD